MKLKKYNLLLFNKEIKKKGNNSKFEYQQQANSSTGHRDTPDKTTHNQDSMSHSIINYMPWAYLCMTPIVDVHTSNLHGNKFSIICSIQFAKLSVSMFGSTEYIVCNVFSLYHTQYANYFSTPKT